MTALFVVLMFQLHWVKLCTEKTTTQFYVGEVGRGVKCSSYTLYMLYNMLYSCYYNSIFNPYRLSMALNSRLNAVGVEMP